LQTGQQVHYPITVLNHGNHYGTLPLTLHPPTNPQVIPYMETSAAILACHISIYTLLCHSSLYDDTSGNGQSMQPTPTTTDILYTI